MEVSNENGCLSQSSIEVTATGIGGVNDDFFVNISGNPTFDQLTIAATNNSLLEMELVNVMGEILFQQTKEFNSSTNTFSIDISEIPSGIYFLVIHTGIESRTFKVVKQ